MTLNNLPGIYRGSQIRAILSEVLFHGIIFYQITYEGGQIIVQIRLQRGPFTTANIFEMDKLWLQNLEMFAVVGCSCIWSIFTISSPLIGSPYRIGDLRALNFSLLKSPLIEFQEITLDIRIILLTFLSFKIKDFP